MCHVFSVMSCVCVRFCCCVVLPCNMFLKNVSTPEEPHSNIQKQDSKIIFKNKKKSSPDGPQAPIVNRQSSIVNNRQSSTIANRQQSSIVNNRQSSIINRQSSIVNRQQSSIVNNRQSSTIVNRQQSSIVNH